MDTNVTYLKICDEFANFQKDLFYICITVLVFNFLNEIQKLQLTRFFCFLFTQKVQKLQFLSLFTPFTNVRDTFNFCKYSIA